MWFMFMKRMLLASKLLTGLVEMVSEVYMPDKTGLVLCALCLSGTLTFLGIHNCKILKK